MRNVNRFLQFFHCQKRNEITTKHVQKLSPHLIHVATLPCEMHQLLKSILLRVYILNYSDACVVTRQCAKTVNMNMHVYYIFNLLLKLD